MVRLTEMTLAMLASRRSQSVVSLDAKVRIPEGILFKELAGETVLLNLNTGVYFGLDPIGTRIWHLVQAGRSLSQILAALLDEFDVEPARCESDLRQLVASLCEQGLLQFVTSNDT